MTTVSDPTATGFFGSRYVFADLRQSTARVLINQFLAELDGLQSSNEGVLILAATNAPWHLDAAFRRPGRFDRIVFVPPPDAPARASILRILLKGKPVENVDYDQLASAWEWNNAIAGKTGLLVIRRGQVVGEWYKDCEREQTFNIYSSSKSYTSTAYGLILSDFGNGPLPNGKTLALDTKVCNADWLPESLPLPDPRKADITLRHLLNMASGIADPKMGGVPMTAPFETAMSPSSMIAVTVNVAFISGSSKEGNAKRAAAASNCVVAYLWPFIWPR